MPVVLLSSSGSQLPTTVSDMIAATHDLLMGTYRQEWNQLASGCGATDVNLAIVGPIGGANRTSYLAIDDEIMYVLSSNVATNSVQVIRGFDGTAPATHLSGALVEVAPRFPRHLIRRQLALEIASWPDNLFQVGTATIQLTNDGRTYAYDLGLTSAQVLFLLEVRHAPWTPGNRNTWPPFRQPPTLNRSVDPATFPSGMALEIPASSGETIGGSVEARVTYATGFNLTSMDDTVLLAPGGIGLSTSMLDIPPLGAAARLLGPREAMRTFGEAADQAADAADDPAGSATKAAIYLKALRDQRIAEEMEHLNVAWPMRAK